MLKKSILLLTLLLMLLVFNFAPGLAQTATPVPTQTGPSSTVTIFMVICDVQVVMNLTGTMLTGDDVYYQVYNGAGGTGTAITGLRRVNVDGVFAFSETAAYNTGTTVAAGATASAIVTIARESNSANTSYTTTVNDLQDGCAAPQNAAGTSQAVDGSAGGTTTTAATTTTSTSPIRSPFGGFINPNYVPPDDALVVIGARTGENNLPRQETPGIIFAECNQYPVALPGVVYDSDDVILFWSWFANTEAQVQDHIAAVNYAVLYYDRVTLPNITITPIQLIDGNYWVFYYSRLGNLRPGRYFFNFKTSWDIAISDGYDDYGPGTANQRIEGGCGFDVVRDIANREVSTNPWPYNIIGNR